MAVLFQSNRLHTEQWCIRQLKWTHEAFHQPKELTFIPIHPFKSKRKLIFNLLQHLTVNKMKGSAERLVPANQRMKCLFHANQINGPGQAQGSRNIVGGSDTPELLLHIDPNLRTSYWIIRAMLRLADCGSLLRFRYPYYPRQLTDRRNRIYLPNGKLDAEAFCNCGYKHHCF
ncbi:hypothetical protein D3C78_844640 [compost metagenome]